ncbi:MAG: hypothetical protein JW910_13585, partial [Anaerolineae bacterium]|nr:hypothetical protein [Anaerolineae bacterium]
IAIGLDLLIGRQSPAVSAVIALGTVGLVVVLMVIGPALGLVESADVKRDVFSEPVGDAASAEVTLGLSVGQATVQALADSPNLIEADLSYVGEIDFQASGESAKIIRLRQAEDSPTSISTWPFASFFPGNSGLELRWDIGLSPAVPLALEIGGGVGDTTLDLAGLQISGLEVNAGVGDIAVKLPDGQYNATLNGGVGAFDVTVSSGADITLQINGGVGSYTVDVPDDAAVRVEADTGLGDVSVPRDFNQISSDDNEIWESEGFAGAEDQIVILFDGGIGDLTIR